MRSLKVEGHSAALEISRHEGSLYDLQPSWQPLIDPAHPGAAFRTFAWISSWWTSASTSQEAEVLVARRHGEVVGLLPLYAEHTRLGGRRLRLMGDGIVGSDWLGAIARPSDLAEVSRGFAAHLRRAGADELQLDDLAADDPLVSSLDGEREPRFKCPYIRTGGSFEDYLEQLPDGIGQQLKRRQRWLEKQPGYRIELCTSVADVERAMRILFELHRQRWALEGGSEAIDGPRVEAFHLLASRKLAELGWARVWLMHVDGAPRAALYGWRHGDRLAFYQAGHEPAWRPRSVGTVLLGHIIRSCFEERLAEFDFLRGEEPYKLKWATGFRETVRVRARGRGLRPELEHQARRGWARLKELARTALPAGGYQRLRALRNQWVKRGTDA